LPQSYKNSTDEELMLEYKSNKLPDALSELFIRYNHLILGVCIKYLQNVENAQDATMQIFEKLVTDLPKYDVQCFKAWLYMCSKNYCLMQLRKNNNNTRYTENIEKYDMETESELHLIYEKENSLNQMHEMLTHLDSHQQCCIDAFYLKKQSYASIQTQYGYTFNEVKTHIQNGKRMLKKLLIGQTS
jgi:RNA polymerase sigma factor (sigma-70 family)